MATNQPVITKSINVSDVFSSLSTSMQGLSESEARSRYSAFGPNTLPEKAVSGPLVLLLRQLKSPLVYVLLGAALITFSIGDYSDTAIILVAVLLNTFLGFFQESRAHNALQALKKYVVTKTTVLRDGKRFNIPTSELVPGDIVILAQGSKVPADGVVVQTNRLFVDEAILTGESMPVSKQQNDPIYQGTTIASGQTTIVVIQTGAKTKIGLIAAKVQEKEATTPFQKQLEDLSRLLVITITSLVAITFIIGLLRSFSLMELIITSVALAVSSIPEGLLVSLTVVLAIGMQRIVRRKGLVRELAAAEILGGITVICADKTGTLTQGKMSLVEWVGNEKDLAVQMQLANDLDDPLLIASYAWGKKIAPTDVDKYKRIDSIPFDSKNRFFASLHKLSSKQNILYINGAPDVILPWTNLGSGEKKIIEKKIEELTNRGMRLIGLARKTTPAGKDSLDEKDVKNGLEWVGILAFFDPVRLGAAEAIKLASQAGIRTMIITGDYANTSKFVLNQLGMNVLDSEIVTGDELEKMSDHELTRRTKTVRLFARTTPDMKLRIVELLKAQGERVAVMGDGVNDAPALYQADIGIAVAEATDVAKESAELILLDSNFATITGAIEEGRGIFENIRKIILYLLCDAFTEIALVVGALIAGLPLPITATQILWINLISDGFPNLALTIDPKRPGLMRQKPFPKGGKLITNWMKTFIGVVSLVASLSGIATFIYIYLTTSNLTLARSVTFLVIGMDSLFYVFSVRTLTTPFWKGNIFANPWLNLAVLAGFILQLLPFANEATRTFFKLEAISPTHIALSIAISLSTFITIEILKTFYQHQEEN